MLFGLVRGSWCVLCMCIAHPPPPPIHTHTHTHTCTHRRRLGYPLTSRPTRLSTTTLVDGWSVDVLPRHIAHPANGGRGGHGGWTRNCNHADIKIHMMRPFEGECLHVTYGGGGGALGLALCVCVRVCACVRYGPSHSLGHEPLECIRLRPGGGAANRAASSSKASRYSTVSWCA